MAEVQDRPSTRKPPRDFLGEVRAWIAGHCRAGTPVEPQDRNPLLRHMGHHSLQKHLASLYASGEVRLETSHLGRRYAMAGVGHSAWTRFHGPRDTPEVRPCLGCGAAFRPAHRHNRLCARCQQA